MLAAAQPNAASWELGGEWLFVTFVLPLLFFVFFFFSAEHDLHEKSKLAFRAAAVRGSPAADVWFADGAGSLLLLLHPFTAQ